MNPTITREYLHAYIDGALTPDETDALDVLAATNPHVREQLLAVQTEFDNHNHSIGSLWRRNQLTCPSNQELADHLRGELAVINPDQADYVNFHLGTIRCVYCVTTTAAMGTTSSEPTKP